MPIDIFFKKYDNEIIATFEHTTKILTVDTKEYDLSKNNNDFIVRCVKILNENNIKWDIYTVK